MKNRISQIIDNKGITGIDLTISIVVLSIFAGLIITFMSNIYKNSTEIQKSTNAMAYATIILEKVDEKPFEYIDENFATTLRNNGELKIEDDYTISFYVEEIKENLAKKITVKVSYNIKGEEKSITINKLKIKEIYKE